ncbi:transmembrane protein 141-like [Argiope bruennichi]|uniref:transmembrane protein 141-like n=1 Tax=Argiope bruennichi TaxID=94029 RepID=UPI0024949E77|nr:transmembrane protein 141-like [Argiope bruennichi]
MNDFKKVKEQYSEKFKGFGVYTECMTRALFYGVSSFALTFSGLYFSQALLKSRLPYSQKYFLILPSVVSTCVAWTVTSRRAQRCQDEWRTSEPLYTRFQ